MASKPPDFKASGVRLERIIASGSASNPKLLIFSSGSAGNDGINVDTNTLTLAGTGTSPLISPARHSQEPGTAVSMIAYNAARRNNPNPSAQVPEAGKARV